MSTQTHCCDYRDDNPEHLGPFRRVQSHEVQICSYLKSRTTGCQWIGPSGARVQLMALMLFLMRSMSVLLSFCSFCDPHSVNKTMRLPAGIITKSTSVGPFSSVAW